MYDILLCGMIYQHKLVLSVSITIADNLVTIDLMCLCLILFVVCDPVMGDEGKLYVPPELVAVYREKVVFFMSGCS